MLQGRGQIRDVINPRCKERFRPSINIEGWRLLRFPSLQKEIYRGISDGIRDANMSALVIVNWHK
jgi:hypothetical protein